MTKVERIIVGVVLSMFLASGASAATWYFGANTRAVDPDRGPARFDPDRGPARKEPSPSPRATREPGRAPASMDSKSETVGSVHGPAAALPPIETVDPQAFLGSLSPAAQQGLAQLLSLLPPATQEQVLVSILQLPLAKADAHLAGIPMAPPEFVYGTVQGGLIILQSLPPELQQPFVNGLFGVSPEEEMFTSQVLALATAAVHGSSVPVPSGVGLPPGWTPPSGTSCADVNWLIALGGGEVLLPCPGTIIR
ncbi:MAG: hypothetical protein ACT4PO_08545 [Actinomycetota bacterium]